MPIKTTAILNRNPISRHHIIVVGGMLLLGASGCYHAPTITGDDQVPNVNVEATAAKDNEFQTMAWPLVDTAMGSLVPNPDSEPGCAVGVVRDHQIIYLKGYGYSRLPDPLHADPGEEWGVNTMGAVGSVAKSFTAVAALQMWEDGLIDINGQVKDYLNTSNTEVGNIRLYDLLSHTSGAGGTTKTAAFQPNFEPDSFAQACIDDDPDFSTAGCQAVIRELAKPVYAFNSYEGNESAPDLGMISADLKHGVYSNVGYSILGAIIDRVAQDSTSSDGYEAYVWDHVGRWSNNPLQGGHMLSLALTHSWRANDIPHRAVGYLGNGPNVQEGWETAGQIEGWEGPSGGWIMTIGDLSRFMIALDENRFFSGTAPLAAMRYEWADLDQLPDLYGFGMFLGPGGSSGPDYWHGGTIGPHNSVWAWYENIFGSEVGVATICNRGDADVSDQKAVANTIAIIASSDGPTQTGTVQQSQVDPASVDGRTYALDLSRSWQTEPRGATIPITGLSNTLLLTPTATRRSLTSFRLEEGTPTKEGIKPSGRSASTLGTRYFSNPRFETWGGSALLASALGDVEINDLVVEGVFTKNGDEMADLSLSGTIDTRQFSNSGGPSFRQICAYIRDAGSACQPCADGQAACVAVRYQGLTAKVDSGSRTSLTGLRR